MKTFNEIAEGIINNMTISSSTNTIAKYAYANYSTMDSKDTNQHDEWIWVDGYKGTDSNMRCRDEQYELGKRFDMLCDDSEIEVCEKGYHLCLKLSDVFGYYHIENGNRFFKVRALVRKKDYDAGGSTSDYSCYSIMPLWMSATSNKIVARSIEFVEECSIDEIFESVDCYDTSNWTDEQKRTALSLGINYVNAQRKVHELVNLGYSEAFAHYIVENKGNNTYEKACTLASIPDLSMDVKVLTIMM